ncbi:hypothetical protein D0869_12253 [Hortaea werneckii]|uniref:Uncharacterized protein n=1 Tax=Hortaea werneckii TaxID=91943 RepID=A0A3M6W8E6_HORWE|nr:hypothetical protein KC324_g7715 [Hortaea werneckii]KAI7582971.1 hypothetical protein KC316_g7556 [Hortaea werneckii]RMX74779.1 hypothetical protein D0869_12253 [Hortaea werneckii]
MGLTQHQPTPARRHFMMTSPRAQAAFHHQQFFFEQNEKLAHLLNTIGVDARNATTISTSSSCTQASTPTTSSDYHELLTVTTHLLSEAQTLSTWTFDMIESNGPQVEPFAEKVALVERVARELRERVLQQQQQQQQVQQMQHLTNTKLTPNTAGLRSCNTTTSAASKKRSRSGEDDEEVPQQQQSQHQQTNPPLSYKRSRVFAPASALRDHYHQQQHQQQQSQQQELMPGIEPTTTSSCGTYAERFLQTPWWVQRPICD